MSRPSRNNADYFPHYNSLRNHRKVKALRNKFGAVVGYAFWCLMLEWLSEQENLEWEYSEVEAEMFAAELGVSAAETIQIVAYCIKLGLLREGNDGVLYSEGLKEQLSPLFEKRERERLRYLEKTTTPKKGHSSRIERENRKSEIVSAAETPQSKVEYSKVEVSKDTKETNAGEPAGDGEISKSKKPAKFNPLTVSLPFTSPAFKQAWADWITHLGEKRKTPTEKSTELQLKKLGKFSEAVAVAMINQSIEKGWQGLFDLKAEDLPKGQTPRQSFKPVTLNDQIKSKHYDPNAT